MDFKVVVTDNALGQLENITDYIVYRLKNKQAANGIFRGFSESH